MATLKSGAVNTPCLQHSNAFSEAPPSLQRMPAMLANAECGGQDRNSADVRGGGLEPVSKPGCISVRMKKVAFVSYQGSAAWETPAASAGRLKVLKLA